MRKLRMPIGEIREVLTAVRAACVVVPVTVETHDLGLQVTERYGTAVYDAMVIAAALLAGCSTLLSEDLQHGQVFNRRLRIRNPFVRG